MDVRRDRKWERNKEDSRRRKKKFFADVHDKFFQFLKLVAWFWLLIAKSKNGQWERAKKRERPNHWMSSTNNQRFKTSWILSRKQFSDFFFFSRSLSLSITFYIIHHLQLEQLPTSTSTTWTTIKFLRFFGEAHYEKIFKKS